jgi:hypothetical protein
VLRESKAGSDVDLDVQVEADDCAYCEAARAYVKWSGGAGVIFFDTEAAAVVRRVEALWLWPLVLACTEVSRDEMARELAEGLLR